MSKRPDHDSQYDHQGDLDVITRVEVPRKYKVILLNDDFTPMNFVTFILQRFFSKSVEEAEKIMMEVHQRGAGIAGVFTKEVAEMKVHQVNTLAQQNEYPLKSTMEAE